LLWLFLSLLSAFFWATADAFTKGRLSHLNPWEMAEVRLLYSLPFLLPLFPFIPPPRLQPGFWKAVGMLLPVEIAALLLYMAAIRSSPLSLTLPFLSFTPLFLTLTGFLLLGEVPSPAGLGGIGLVVLGGYLLNLGRGEGVMAPVKAVFSERGSWMMLIVALLYSYTSAMGKLAILRSHPLFFGPFYVLILTGVISALSLLWGKLRPRELFRHPLWGLLVGGATAAMLLCHYVAITMVDAAYMIAVKRTSPLFGVLYGGLLLGEEKMGRRLLATGLMVAGVILIGILG